MSCLLADSITPRSTPTYVGVLLMELGKIQLYLHRRSEAMASLTDVSGEW